MDVLRPFIDKNYEQQMAGTPRPASAVKRLNCEEARADEEVPYKWSGVFHRIAESKKSECLLSRGPDGQKYFLFIKFAQLFKSLPSHTHTHK